jgi:hypothetical protein
MERKHGKTCQPLGRLIARRTSITVDFSRRSGLDSFAKQV